MTTLIRICRVLTDRRLAPTAVRFIHRRLDKPSDMEKFFGCAIEVPARLLLSSRSYADIIYREELERLGSEPGGPGIVRTLTRSAAGSRRTTPPRAPIRFCQKRLQLFDQA